MRTYRLPSFLRCRKHGDVRQCEEILCYKRFIIWTLDSWHVHSDWHSLVSWNHGSIYPCTINIKHGYSVPSVRVVPSLFPEVSDVRGSAVLAPKLNRICSLLAIHVFLKTRVTEQTLARNATKSLAPCSSRLNREDPRLAADVSSLVWHEFWGRYRWTCYQGRATLEFLPTGHTEDACLNCSTEKCRTHCQEKKMTNTSQI